MSREAAREYGGIVSDDVARPAGVHSCACVDELGAIHGGSDAEVAFRFVTDPADGSIHVVGSVDAADAPGFRRLLAAAGELGPIVIRLDRCEYLDHTALVAIDQVAARHGTTARLVGARSVVVRLSGLLELAHVAVQRP